MTFSIRVFDTILSEDFGDSVSRNSADFWKIVCLTEPWNFNYERIHSTVDVEFFFSKKTIREDVIIFSGHGDDKKGFTLSNADCLDGKEHFDISPNNKGKIIIFSACLIGLNPRLSKRLKRFFQAKHLFAYQSAIGDQFCFINEYILLRNIDKVMLQEHREFTHEDFTKFTKETSFLKTLNIPSCKKHPMVMF